MQAWLKPTNEKPRGTGLPRSSFVAAFPAASGGAITAYADKPAKPGSFGVILVIEETTCRR
jgi:hypothetical protein